MACTLNNSIVVAADGDVYIWGKTGAGLLNEIGNSTYKVLPIRLDLPKKLKYYKAVHVSCGL